jgi:probable F420-dependent oxidoreductase
VKISGIVHGDLKDVPERIRELEQAGFDAAASVEISNDPFFPLVLAAEHSERIGLMTAIAVAFARNPMTLANIAHDLNAYSRGRFVLGIGSQIAPHITRRLSMPWSRPAARMREFILAMRAIWRCWYQGEPLDFRGEFYTHTLMTPMFVPADTSHGAPRVVLAAVGPKMTEVAAEVADGMLAHGFTTRRYLEEVTLPAIERGLAAAGRSRADFEIVCPTIVVSGPTEEAWAQSRTAVCQQIAFYGSTPAYRPVLELHGWGDLQSELNRLSKAGQWVEMGTLIEDDILREFAIVEEPQNVAASLKRRCDGLIDTWLCTNDGGSDAARHELVSALRD